MDAIDRDIEARLLGKFTLATSDGTSLLPKYRKSQGVLAYLLYHHDRPVPRAKLADLFWPDRDVRQGLASLRQSMSEIRTAFGPLRDVLIDARRTAITLHGRRVRFDLWDQTGSIAAAAEGVLLDGLDPVSPGFDEWLFGERRHLDRRRIMALERDLAAKFADPGRRLAAALQILRLDARHEQAARTAMDLLAARGQISRAIQIYADIEAALRANGFALDPETQRLYHALQRQSGPVPATPPDMRSEHTPCVAIAITMAEKSNALPNLQSILHQRLAEIREFRFTPTAAEADYHVTLQLHAHADRLAAQVTVQHRPTGRDIAASELAGEESGSPSDASMLAGDVAAAILTAIAEDQAHSLDTTPQENWGAYRHYLRGRMLVLGGRDADDLLKAERHLERAVALQPDFVLPYPWLILIYNSARGNAMPGLPREPGLAHGLSLVRRLLLLDDGYAGAHLAFCWCLIRMHQFDLAQQSLAKAIARNPADPLELTIIARAALFLGDVARAASFHDLARRRIATRRGRWATDLGELAYLMGDYPAALGHFEADAEDGAIRARVLRAAALARLGRTKDALADVRWAEAWFQRHWQGPLPYAPDAAIRWYLEDFALKRPEDLDNIREGLRAAGFAI